MRLRTEIAYKADGPGKAAQHAKAQGSSPQVNAEAVQLQFAFLSGETSMSCGPNKGSGVTGNRPTQRGGVSRGHSTADRAGRPEPVGCVSSCDPREATETPYGRVDVSEASQEKPEDTQTDLLTSILSRENMLAAWQRVKANKGAPGMDDMSIAAFPAFAKDHWDRIRTSLEQGIYRPAAVLRVMIPKATGGQRPLGIPTVLDRVIQQAIAQVITPLFDPHFSTYSFGFRPGRRAKMAIDEMERAHRDGLRFAVDCDLKGFFDTVHHGLLMQRLARRIGDRRVLRLIGRYLRAGVILPDGQRASTSCGVPQGGPLSPLLANVMLDDLDQELTKRGLRFARYADDFLIFVGSQRAADRVLKSISRFIKGRLRLTINWTKSKAARLTRCSFLGFRMKGGKLCWTPDAASRFKDRIREITARSNGRSMPYRISVLRRYITGWLNYFGHSRTYQKLVDLDHWLRRRVRLCFWKSWKRPRTRRRHLLNLGIPVDQVKMATRSRKGYWRMAGNSIVQRAMTNTWLWDQGVPDMRKQWIGLHYGAKAS